jgi:hypothetical protein
MAKQQTQGYATWAEVVAHVKEKGWVRYQAPLDHQPVLVRAFIFEHEGFPLVRVLPDRKGVDPFYADDRHLSRFRKDK